MPLFKLLIEDRAVNDIQLGFEYYEDKVPGLGVQFNKQLILALEHLKSNPFHQVRYSTIRCYPIKKFPYLIHYEVDEEHLIVKVFAIISTFQNPKEQWLKS